MRILLLEDEEAIRGFIRINLKRNGMDVTEAEDGETALALAYAASPPFDVALLDVMLPTISGFEVCGELREKFPRMGIIMLTAKSQEEDKIRGLELGADDYVQKPFSPGELIARVNALHRRMMPGGLTSQENRSFAETGQADAGQSGNPEAEAGRLGDSAADQGRDIATAELGGSGTRVHGGAGLSAEADERKAGGLASGADPGGAVNAGYGSGGTQGSGEEQRSTAQAPNSREEVAASAGQSAGARTGELCSGPFRLSSAERRLWKGSEEIVLTPTEWTLVMLLMEREGEGLSRDDILDAVWGRHFIGDLKIVDVNIRRIRQKLEDEPSDPRYIETLWGFGYRWKRSVL